MNRTPSSSAAAVSADSLNPLARRAFLARFGALAAAGAATTLPTARLLGGEAED